MIRRRSGFLFALMVSGIGLTTVAQQPGGYFNNANQVSSYGQPAYYDHQSADPYSTQVPNGYPVYSHAGSSGQSGYAQHLNQHGQAAACGHYGGQCGCGQQPSSFWTNYYRNQRWPQPFTAVDVASVTRIFDIQRENGWRLHNTVGHAMFDAQNNCLTQAGKNHIQSILADNPSDRKAVFVMQGRTPEQTAARVQSTELAISQMVPVGALPPVMVTDRDPPGSSGAYQTAVTKMMMTSVPAPRLGNSNGPSGSASGSSSPSGR